ncbi:PIN domain-containing protein [Hyphomicrobiaceae bacterium 22]|uniref:PIN domain-containing protein n=1 Tax=Prosthecodimorpha staleyi TaxID=2840188 RepID=A0A947DA73_9HYPH|nr:PIN domain-containing protein [Prosthecodimorpha staleyi]MBT9291292.1 PIN domain-containing protein [Prosthecodimorpha staleyi]
MNCGRNTGPSSSSFRRARCPIAPHRISNDRTRHQHRVGGAASSPGCAGVGFPRWNRRPACVRADTVLAELRYGVEILEPSRRQRQLVEMVDAIEFEHYRDRLLTFDAVAARLSAVIRAQRRRIGRPVAVIDAQIAAIARANGMRLVTRNVRDFEATGVDLVDPFAL